MASRQEEPGEYEEEYESESDKGLVAFFETISVWIIGTITVIKILKDISFKSASKTVKYACYFINTHRWITIVMVWI